MHDKGFGLHCWDKSEEQNTKEQPSRLVVNGNVKHKAASQVPRVLTFFSFLAQRSSFLHLLPLVFLVQLNSFGRQRPSHSLACYPPAVVGRGEISVGWWWWHIWLLAGGGGDTQGEVKFRQWSVPITCVSFYKWQRMRNAFCLRTHTQTWRPMFFVLHFFAQQTRERLSIPFTFRQLLMQADEIRKQSSFPVCQGRNPDQDKNKSWFGSIGCVIPKREINLQSHISVHPSEQSRQHRNVFWEKRAYLGHWHPQTHMEQWNLLLDWNLLIPLQVAWYAEPWASC